MARPVIWGRGALEPPSGPVGQGASAALQPQAAGEEEGLGRPGPRRRADQQGPARQPRPPPSAGPSPPAPHAAARPPARAPARPGARARPAARGRRCVPPARTTGRAPRDRGTRRLSGPPGPPPAPPTGSRVSAALEPRSAGPQETVTSAEVGEARLWSADTAAPLCLRGDADPVFVPSVRGCWAQPFASAAE